MVTFFLLQCPPRPIGRHQSPWRDAATTPTTQETYWRNQRGRRTYRRSSIVHSTCLVLPEPVQTQALQRKYRHSARCAGQNATISCFEGIDAHCDRPAGYPRLEASRPARAVEVQPCTRRTPLVRRGTLDVVRRRPTKHPLPARPATTAAAERCRRAPRRRSVPPRDGRVLKGGSGCGLALD